MSFYAYFELLDAPDDKILEFFNHGQYTNIKLKNDKMLAFCEMPQIQFFGKTCQMTYEHFIYQIGIYIK